jgi:hypothetical protein
VRVERFRRREALFAGRRFERERESRFDRVGNRFDRVGSLRRVVVHPLFRNPTRVVVFLHFFFPLKRLFLGEFLEVLQPLPRDGGRGRQRALVELL